MLISIICGGVAAHTSATNTFQTHHIMDHLDTVVAHAFDDVRYQGRIIHIHILDIMHRMKIIVSKQTS